MKLYEQHLYATPITKLRRYATLIKSLEKKTRDIAQEKIKLRKLMDSGLISHKEYITKSDEIVMRLNRLKGAILKWKGIIKKDY